jgi:Zn-dependent protease
MSDFLGRIFNFDLVSLLISLPAIVVSLSFHEAAHAYVAYRCGDPTAKNMGRLTLNPLRHIDPIGFIMLLVVHFGYARPVPVNPLNFRRGYRDDLLVSIAGIAMNLLLCVGFSVILGTLLIYMDKNGFYYANAAESVLSIALNMVYSFVVINLSLAVFNLLPIPPLDGYHVVNDLILRGRGGMTRITASVGQALLLVLIFTGITSRILGFVQTHYFSLFYSILNAVMG